MCTSAMRTKILELEISAPMQDQTLEIHLKNVSEWAECMHSTPYMIPLLIVQVEYNASICYAEKQQPLSSFSRLLTRFSVKRYSP